MSNYPAGQTRSSNSQLTPTSSFSLAVHPSTTIRRTECITTLKTEAALLYTFTAHKTTQLSTTMPSTPSHFSSTSPNQNIKSREVGNGTKRERPTRRQTANVTWKVQNKIHRNTIRSNAHFHFLQLRYVHNDDYRMSVMHATREIDNFLVAETQI